jgi:hypothetical protein
MHDLDEVKTDTLCFWLLDFSPPKSSVGLATGIEPAIF